MEKGSISNVTGSVLEGTVKNILSSKGFELVKYRDWEKNNAAFGDELLLMNVPFITVYGHKGNTEFLLRSKKYNLEIRIECKWQQTAGSVDEKLPYLYLNCIEAMPENNIMILIDGKGWKDGAKKWLNDAVSKKLYTSGKSVTKQITVFDITGFITWANRTFMA